MLYKLVKTQNFNDTLGDFLSYLSFYGKSEKFIQNILEEIDEDICKYILPDPYFSPYHHYFGAPYRALLYKYSKRSTYWLVYTIDEVVKTIKLLSFWHAARDPESFL